MISSKKFLFERETQLTFPGEYHLRGKIGIKPEIKATNTMKSIIDKQLLVPLASITERDTNVIMPILYYLEKIYGYQTKITDVLNLGEFNHNWRAAIFANINGEKICLKVAGYVYPTGLPVIYLEAEGNYVEDRLDQFFWGYNTKKERIIDKHFLWSEKCRQMVLKKYPELKSHVDVSGAVGFDRYAAFEPKGKKYLLEKYGRENFQDVVAYACFGFDKVFLETDFKTCGNPFLNDLELVRKDCATLKQMLESAIQNYQDKLFILKIHPQQFDFRYIEIGLDWDKIYPNVLILKNEEELQDLLGACDLWLSYESTTTLETWCMKKETVMLIPSPCYSWRTNLYRGSSVARNSGELKMLIDEYYSHGSIRQFEEKKKTREEIITDSIGSADGLNAFRTAKKIDEFLKNNDAVREISVWNRLFMFCFRLFFRLLKPLTFLVLIKKFQQLKNILAIEKKGALIKEKYFEKMDRSRFVSETIRRMAR